jgi:hypothetical protein
MFLRNFAQVWGVTIGGTILQNELEKRIPADLLSQFSVGNSIAYATIPLISGMPEPLRSEVQAIFAESLKVIWQTFTGIAGIGLLASFAMKALPLHTSMNDQWAMEEKRGSQAPNAPQV